MMVSTVPATVQSGQSLRGFSAALMLASVLAATAAGVLGTSMSVRIATGGLGAAGCAIGWTIISRGQSRRFPLLLAAALGVLGFFVWHLVQSSPPFPLRSLHVATTLCYGAIALAVALRILRVTDEGRALLFAFSIAVPLFVGDLLVTPPQPLGHTRWQSSGTSHPEIGFRYAANSAARNFYPDNPRNYFERSDPARDSWAIEMHEGNVGLLDYSESRIRVTIPKLIAPGSWQVKLFQTPFQIQAGREYIVLFRARADAPRRISCTVGQNHDPWDRLGPYIELEVETDWKQFECPFTATGSDANARIFFDLAYSDVPVEFSDVVLRDAATGTPVLPDIKEEFFISYRFNSLGFRGPDYALPALPGTFRILALGDSYTQGVGVHEQDTFSSQLQDRLNRNGPGSAVKYEVINAGVTGYATRQQRLSYELFASSYAPQVVLVAMVFNDDLAAEEEARRGYTWSPSRLAGLSSVWARVEDLRRPQRVYDYTPSIRELLELNEAAQRRGARLAVVIFRSSEFREWAPLTAAVTEGVRGTGIPVIDLGPAILRNRSVAELEVHPIDRHPNEIAHRVAAEEIETFLRKEKLLP